MKYSFWKRLRNAVKLFFIALFETERAYLIEHMIFITKESKKTDQDMPTELLTVSVNKRRFLKRKKKAKVIVSTTIGDEDHVTTKQDENELIFEELIEQAQNTEVLEYMPGPEDDYLKNKMEKIEKRQKSTDRMAYTMENLASELQPLLKEMLAEAEECGEEENGVLILPNMLLNCSGYDMFGKFAVEQGICTRYEWSCEGVRIYAN